MIWKIRLNAFAVLALLLIGIPGAKAQVLWVQTNKALALYGQPVPADSYTEILGEIGNSWVTAPAELAKWDGIQLIPKADATLVPLFQYNNKVNGTINQVTTAFDDPGGMTTGGRYPYGIKSLEAYPSKGVFMYPCTSSPCAIFTQTNQTVAGTQVIIICRYPGDYYVQVPGADDGFIIPIAAVDISSGQDVSGYYTTAPPFLPKDLRISKVPTDQTAPPPDLTASDDQGQPATQTTAPDSNSSGQSSEQNDNLDSGQSQPQSGEELWVIYGLVALAAAGAIFIIRRNRPIHKSENAKITERFPPYHVFRPEAHTKIWKYLDKAGYKAVLANACDAKQWENILNQFPSPPSSDEDRQEREALCWRNYAELYSAIDENGQRTLKPKQEIVDFFKNHELWMFRYYYGATGVVNKPYIELLLPYATEAYAYRSGTYRAPHEALNSFSRDKRPEHYQKWSEWFFFHVSDAFRKMHQTDADFGPQSVTSPGGHPADDDLAY